MKLCNTHFADLCTMLKRKNLWRLVSNDAGLARAKAARWLAGTARIEEIDPLAVSVLEINQKTVTMVGDYVDFPVAGGKHRCPLCEAQRKFGHRMADDWIDNCTDAVKAVVLANGL